MKNIIYAVKDLFCNFLNWHGRLSKQGYWYAWLGVFIVNILLLLPLNDLDVLQTNKIFFCAIRLWNVITFFPMLFAAMRRYHDIGKAGWKVIILVYLVKLAFSRVLYLLV